MWVEKTISTPVGLLTICADEAGICALRFGGQSFGTDETPLLKQAQRELEEYFAGRRREFSVPLSIHGTGFQREVWQALRSIPYGHTVTYGELARSLGRPGAARAVGMANHRNPLPVFIPCHRVIGAGGALTGYAGGLETKKKLLAIEGIDVKV